MNGELPRPTFYEGREWLQRSLRWRKITPSPFALEVADLLGEVFYGIYHISDAVFSKSSIWDSEEYVELCFSCGYALATVDDDSLTRLVLLAHDYGIRVEIQPCTFRHLTLYFHPRKTREGDISHRHPTAEQALSAHRRRYPAPQKCNLPKGM